MHTRTATSTREVPSDGRRAAANWLVDAKTLERVHLSIARGRPFGDDSWTARVARRYGLESTLRDPWRPRKPTKKGA